MHEIGFEDIDRSLLFSTFVQVRYPRKGIGGLNERHIANQGQGSKSGTDRDRYLPKELKQRFGKRERCW
jgi:hypothetical protein